MRSPAATLYPPIRPEDHNENGRPLAGLPATYRQKGLDLCLYVAMATDQATRDEANPRSQKDRPLLNARRFR